MNWKVLKTEDEYIAASNRLMEIFDAESNTPEGNELELLLVSVKDYDDRNYRVAEADVLKIT